MTHLMQGLAMGGYGAYIWPAYGVAVALLVLNAFSINWQRKRTYKKLRQWFERQI